MRLVAPPEDIAEEELRVLIPVLRAQTSTPLLELGDALVTWDRGEGQVLGLVEVPPLVSRAAGLRAAMSQRNRRLLRWIAANDRNRGPHPHTRLGVQVRVTHRLAWGVREAVYENGSNLIVIEWPGLESRRHHSLLAVIEDLAAQPPADLALVRPDPTLRQARLDARSVLVPVRGGPNARLALRIGSAMAAAQSGVLTALHVYDASHHPDRQAQEGELFRELVAAIRYDRVRVAEERSDEPYRTILKEACHHSTVVIGASAEPSEAPILVAKRMAETVRHLGRTVVLAKSWSA